ncbi:hypothetical protein, partial [Thiolapillus sp.]|uniref:hypothetical protein n=1 Tax=Thiolapillus sp. TaxID=2017437 RepID=UPI003AF4E9D3
MITNWGSPKFGSKAAPVGFIIIKFFICCRTIPGNTGVKSNGDGEMVAGQRIVAHRPPHIT